MEEFEELKLEKEKAILDLLKYSENLEMTKSQLQETEQLLTVFNRINPPDNLQNKINKTVQNLPHNNFSTTHLNLLLICFSKQKSAQKLHFTLHDQNSSTTITTSNQFITKPETCNLPINLKCNRKETERKHLDYGNATCNIIASGTTLRQHDQHHLSPSAGQGKLRVAIHGYGGQSPAICRREPSIQPLQPSSNDNPAVICHALACRWLDLSAMALHPELQPKPHLITNTSKAASSVHHNSINLQASSEPCYGSAYGDNEWSNSSCSISDDFVSMQ